MSTSFTKKDVTEKSHRELQQLCKSVSVKAVGTSDALRERLLAWLGENNSTGKTAKAETKVSQRQSKRKRDEEEEEENENEKEKDEEEEEEAEEETKAVAETTARKSSRVSRSQTSPTTTTTAKPKAKAKAKAKAKTKAAKEEKKEEKKAEKEEKNDVFSSLLGPNPNLPLDGQIFAMSGGFQRGSGVIQQMLESRGAVCRDAVSKTTTFFVCGTAQMTAYGQKSGPGSKKCKEAKKMKRPILSEADVLKLCGEKTEQASKDELLTLITNHLSKDVAGLVMSYATHPNPSVQAWMECLDITDQEPNPAATAEEIKEVEDTVGQPIPKTLKELLLFSNGSGCLVATYPSTSDILEQFGYNDVQQPMYRSLKWFPFGQIDYDFCYNVMDASGLIITIDHENGSENVIASNLDSYVSGVHRLVCKIRDEVAKGTAVIAAGKTEPYSGQYNRLDQEIDGGKYADQFHSQLHKVNPFLHRRFQQAARRFNGE